MKPASTKRILAGMLAAGACVPALAQEKTPNVVIILADDLGYGDLGFTGSSQIRTPNIDALAASGVVCTSGYVTSAVSSPSRAGLLTGKNQVTFGYDNNLGSLQPQNNPDMWGLPVKEKTIADRLKGAGYTTGIVGKWHLGEEDQFHPLKRGFDEFWGYLVGGHDYFMPAKPGKRYQCPIISTYGSKTEYDYLTDAKGDECVSFIKRHKEEPFFLYASFNAPHAPFQAKESDLAKYAHIKDVKRRTYCAMISCLDDNVGKIMDALKKNGLYENTIVFFLSDNGGPSHGAACNYPYRGYKGCLLEGGIHVPYVVSYPGVLEAGQTYDKPVVSYDIAATACALAGAEKKGLEGVDLLPFFKGENAAEPHEEMMWRFTISAAVRQGNYKLIRIPDRLPMLYDLSKDATERNDIFMENIELGKSMLKKLGQWDIRLPHVLFFEGGVYRKAQVGLYDLPYVESQPEE